MLLFIRATYVNIDPKIGPKKDYEAAEKKERMRVVYYRKKERTKISRIRIQHIYYIEVYLHGRKYFAICHFKAKFSQNFIKFLNFIVFNF